MADTTYYTNCFRIERTDGYIICLTELDKDLYIDDQQLEPTWDNIVQTYLSAAGYTPTNMQSTSDNAVNNADVEGVLSAIGVQREDIIGGRYDFARIHMFLWDWKNNTLVKKLGSGHWGEVTIKDGSYVAEFRSLSQQLQQTIGRTYNPECDEQFCGTRCQLDVNNYTTTGTVTNVLSNGEFENTILVPQSDGYFNYGKLTFTSGLNNVIHMEVKNYTLLNNTVELFLPMPFEIKSGDTFEVIAGCDKRLVTCKGFNNIINFQGFPFIPGIDQISKFGGQ